MIYVVTYNRVIIGVLCVRSVLGSILLHHYYSALFVFAGDINTQQAK